jgi:hypothetical protein
MCSENVAYVINCDNSGKIGLVEKSLIAVIILENFPNYPLKQKKPLSRNKLY